MKTLVLIPSLFVIILVLSTCRKNDFKNLDCSGIDSKYSTVISSIISANCAVSGCHNGSSSNFDLRTYSQVKAKVDDGSFKREVIDKRSMPKNGKLTQDELNKIKCWLDQGAPNN